MNREQRRERLNEFRDALVDECLDKADDYEDVAYYAQEVIEIYKAWELPGTDDEIVQKISGAVRKCSNSEFKGKSAGATL